MKPKEIFSVAIRLLGLCFLYHGLLAAPRLLTAFVGGPLALFATVFDISWPLLVAYWLLGGAPLLMQIAYPGPDAETPK